MRPRLVDLARAAPRTPAAVARLTPGPNGATLGGLSAWEHLTSAVIPLLVAFFNLLIAGHSLAGARKNPGWLAFGVGPAGVGIWALAWFLSVLEATAVGTMQAVGSVGGVLAVAGFAYDGARAVRGRRARWAVGAAGLLTLGLLGLMTTLVLERAEEPGLALLAGAPRMVALGLLALVGLTSLARARAEDPGERALGRRLVVVLVTGGAGYTAFAVAALLDSRAGVDPLLLVVLCAEAVALSYVVQRRVELHILLPRALASALLSLVVVGFALLALWGAGVAVDVGLVASAVAIALFAGLVFLGLGELVSRGVTRLLFPAAARLEQALEASRTEAAALRRRLDKVERLAIAGELAASVAHEIKNPLSPIRGYAQLLATKLERVAPEERPLFAKALGIIQSESDRIDTRVRELLELSRGDRPPPSLDATAELHQVLLEAIAVAEGEPAVHEVRRSLDASLGRVVGEADALRGALANVLKNAAEAMEPVGGGVVEVRTERRGTRAVVEVLDEGVGLAPEVPERAFESFYTTKAGGTGLGLAIVRSAIEAAGGLITLEPRRDRRGACVRIELPVAEARPEPGGAGPRGPADGGV